MKKHKNFIIISIIILFLDLIFISINYSRSKDTLNESILEHTKKEKESFNLVMTMSYRNMKQISKHFSRNDILNNLFLQGSKAVESEGGGTGGVKAQGIRKKILTIVEDDWNLMINEFQIRQFHYHLGPGSLSFLRVHKPNKFGDRMDDIRHTIVDTNLEHTPRTGFETGRVYSGLRSVVPIWAIDPETNKNVYVGALEVGTSFDQLLSILSNNSLVTSEFSVLLSKEHIKSSVWPEFYQTKMKKNKSIDYYLESTSTSRSNVEMLLENTNLSEDFKLNKVNIFQIDDKYITTDTIPFKDYISTKHPKSPPVGFVLISSDVTKLVNSFYASFYINILFSVIALLIIEVTLILLFQYEKKLKKISMHDYLTKLPNRNYFHEYSQTQLALAERKNEKLAILFMDLDDFKAINDGISHNAGDLVLKTISKRCSDFVRKNEFIARIGGDEFCMVIYGYKDDNELVGAAERLIKYCSNEIIIGDISIKQGISVGIARYPCDAMTLDKLVKKSDLAMYSVKKHKKGTFAFISDYL